MIESNFDSEILSKVKEHKVSDIIKGKKIYERSKFISVNEGLNELIETSEKCEKEEYRSVISLESLWFDFSRIGSETQVIKCWKIKDVLNMDFGMTLHSNSFLMYIKFLIEENYFFSGIRDIFIFCFYIYNKFILFYELDSISKNYYFNKFKNFIFIINI